MAKQVGLNAIIEQTAKSIKKIRDIPNYKDSPEYKVINQQLNNQHWSTENGFVKLDTDEKIRLHQEIMYHSGTTRTNKNLWYHDQPWMQEKGVFLGNVNKKGKPSRVKAKQAFGKVQDPSEIGYNDDALYKGTQAAQEADRKFNLAPGTTGYTQVHARLAQLDPDGSLGFNTPEMFNEIKRFNIRTVKDKLDIIKQLNADLKRNGVTKKSDLYSAGHGYSRASGGPATARNYGFPELGKDNYRTQNVGDLPRKDLDEIGIDTSWSMFVDRYLSDVHGAGLIEKTEAQKFLTDADLLDILSKKVDWKTALSKRIAAQNNTL
jgi:hypothetical protein